MKRRTAKETKTTAYHEAGHAVVMVHFGLGFHMVTIKRNYEKASEGDVAHPGLIGGYENCETTKDRRIAARQLILANYAGLAAQKLVEPDAPDWRAEADENNAFELSREHGVMPRGHVFAGSPEHHAFLDRLRKEATRLVQDLSGPISKLADELLVRKKMTGKEVELFVEPLL